MAEATKVAEVPQVVPLTATVSSAQNEVDGVSTTAVPASVPVPTQPIVIQTAAGISGSIEDVKILEENEATTGGESVADEETSHLDADEFYASEAEQKDEKRKLLARLKKVQNDLKSYEDHKIKQTEGMIAAKELIDRTHFTLLGDDKSLEFTPQENQILSLIEEGSKRAKRQWGRLRGVFNTLWAMKSVRYATIGSLGVGAVVATIATTLYLKQKHNNEKLVKKEGSITDCRALYRAIETHFGILVCASVPFNLFKHGIGRTLNWIRTADAIVVLAASTAVGSAVIYNSGIKKVFRAFEDHIDKFKELSVSEMPADYRTLAPMIIPLKEQKLGFLSYQTKVIKKRFDELTAHEMICAAYEFSMSNVYPPGWEDMWKRVRENYTVYLTIKKHISKDLADFVVSKHFQIGVYAIIVAYFIYELYLWYSEAPENEVYRVDKLLGGPVSEVTVGLREGSRPFSKEGGNRGKQKKKWRGSRNFKGYGGDYKRQHGQWMKEIGKFNLYDAKMDQQMMNEQRAWIEERLDDNIAVTKEAWEQYMARVNYQRQIEALQNVYDSDDDFDEDRRDEKEQNREWNAMENQEIEDELLADLDVKEGAEQSPNVLLEKQSKLEEDNKRIKEAFDRLSKQIADMKSENVSLRLKLKEGEIPIKPPTQSEAEEMFKQKTWRGIPQGILKPPPVIENMDEKVLTFKCEKCARTVGLKPKINKAASNEIYPSKMYGILRTSLLPGIPKRDWERYCIHLRNRGQKNLCPECNDERKAKLLKQQEKPWRREEELKKEGATSLPPFIFKDYVQYYIKVWAIDNECEDTEFKQICDDDERLFEAGWGYNYQGKWIMPQHLVYKNAYTDMSTQQVKRFLLVNYKNERIVVSVANALKNIPSADYLEFQAKTVNFVPAVPLANWYQGKCYTCNPMDFKAETSKLSSGYSPVVGHYDDWTTAGWSGLIVWQSKEPLNKTNVKLGCVGMHIEGGHDWKYAEQSYPNYFVSNALLGKNF